MPTGSVSSLTEAHKTPSDKPQKPYGKIVLTLYNLLLPESVFKETPSQADGIDVETETDLRVLGCELIQTSGILLKLPQVVSATAQMYFQRFYYSKSFMRYPMEAMAMGSIYLASKVEEKPRGIQDIINVFHHMKQVRAQKIITPLVVDQKFMQLKNEVIKAESRILKEIGFCVYVKHPHKLVVVYSQLLQLDKNSEVMQMAWNYLSDALRTDVFVRFSPETIACACIYLTARKFGLPLPNDPHWFLLFKVTEKDIREVCTKILMLYKRPKVNQEELENKINSLRKISKANKLGQSQIERDVATTESAELSQSPESCESTASPTPRSKEVDSKTPPLPSKHRNESRMKERRTRSPNDRNHDSRKRYRCRSRDRSIERSQERRYNDKRSRGGCGLSRKYDYYDHIQSKRGNRDYRRRY